MTFTRALSTNNYGPAKFIVDGSNVANGTHTTIAAALTSASSGDTIFIRPGTYTENLTLKAGVNLTAFECDSSLNGTGHVIISGTCTLTTAGSVTISGIQLQTNSAALLAVTGSAASVVNLENCYLNCTNTTGITFSSSSASALINIMNCNGDLGTTGIAYFSHSSAGVLIFAKGSFTNSGNSTTANTISAGFIFLTFVNFVSPITTSGTAGIGMSHCIMNLTVLNTTVITHGGSSATTRSIFACQLGSGTASAISIGATLLVFLCDINSTNTNAITGAGTINYSGITFSGTSTTINTTTQTVSGTLQGSKNTAPTAGMLGERISSAVTAVATTSATPKDLTSLSLTAGVWDLAGNSQALPSGGTNVMTASALGISATSATLAGTQGINYLQTVVTATNQIPMWAPLTRVTLTTTTTYYLVINNTYTATTCPTNGQFTATRVG